MLKKLRSDSTFNQLTPAQRQTLEHWLLDLNLGYQEVLERLQREWGLSASRSSIGRFARRQLEVRAGATLREAQATALRLQAAGADLKTLRDSSLKLVAARLQQKAMDQNSGAKELCALSRVLLSAQERELQTERAALARERAALQREKFEFRAAAAAWKLAPLLDEFRRQEFVREEERMALIRQRIFGRELEHVKDPLFPNGHKIIPLPGQEESLPPALPLSHFAPSAPNPGPQGQYSPKSA